MVNWRLLVCRLLADSRRILKQRGSVNCGDEFLLYGRLGVAAIFKLCPVLLCPYGEGMTLLHFFTTMFSTGSLLEYFARLHCIVFALDCAFYRW